MAESNEQEKTEEPTQQRREDFRKRGQVAQTKEFASALFLFSFLLLMWFAGRFFLKQAEDVFTMSFTDYLVRAVREGDWIVAAHFAISKIFLITGPIFGFLWLISFASGALQVGFLYNEEALQFKPERLDPMEGFKRIFSLRSVVEGIKAVAKVLAVGLIAYLILKDEIAVIPHLVTYSVGQLITYVGSVVFKLIGTVGFFVLVISGLDFLYQRYDLEQKMMMSRQEVREELKSREGDPLIKQRIKRVQRELANRRMMDAVPKADVIVTNPTHISVALKYDDTMIAPTIVAMGADHLAFKIREVAKEHGIPLVENKPLARTIYKTLKIGQMIPRELYTAVAEVLSYVYKLRRKSKGQV
ncbi:MAG: flagellar biosynthesis protein FlhB [Bdellovibrionales bacterium]|nr:flagellar biosynthesis protein FlhB [Bdellovibrionales bacterium]